MSYARDFGDPEIGKAILIDYPLHVTRDENENFLGLFIGQSGLGKTWAAVRMAEKLDPTFDVSRVCVSYKEFLNKLNEMAELWDAKEDVAGRVIIFDEFQKSASARKFMSAVNQAINDVLHTFRYLNLIVLFTTPHMSFIDVNSRAMLRFQVAIVEKRKEIGLTRGELLFNQIKNDPRNPSDKLYHFAPRLFTENGALKVRQVWFERPSSRMAKAVDEKINSFKHSVLTEAITRNDARELEESVEQKTQAQKLREQVNEIYINKGRYYDGTRGKWDKGAILMDYPELTPGRVSSMIPLLKRMVDVGIKPGDIDGS